MAFLKVPNGCGSVSVKGVEYLPEDNGLIQVPDDCVELLKPHGYEQVDESKHLSAPASKSVEKQEVPDRQKKPKH
jgi:hypothetical protein